MFSYIFRRFFRDWKEMNSCMKKTCPRNVYIITNSRLIHIYICIQHLTLMQTKKWTRVDLTFHPSSEISITHVISGHNGNIFQDFKRSSGKPHHELNCWLHSHRMVQTQECLIFRSHLDGVGWLLPTICPTQKYTITTLPLKKMGVLLENTNFFFWWIAIFHGPAAGVQVLHCGVLLGKLDLQEFWWDWKMNMNIETLCFATHE